MNGLTPMQVGDAPPAITGAGNSLLTQLRQRLFTWVRTSFKPRFIVLATTADVLASPGAALEPALQAFSAWCEAHPGTVCELGLSGAWMLTSVSPSGWTREAAHEHALRQWQHYGGLESEDIQANWLLRALKVTHAQFTCAVPIALVQGLQEVARTHGVQLVGVTPWWLRAAQSWFDDLVTQADGLVQGQWQLDLIEPDLVTHVQASLQAKGAELDAIWAEVRGHEGGTQAARPVTNEARSDARHVGLQIEASSSVGGDEVAQAPWQSHVWDHEALQPVLRGEAVAHRGAV